MAGLFVDFNPFQRLASNQQGFVSRTITRGSLIAFTYPTSHATKPNVIHDPYPLLIVTDIWPNFVRGVNLHYMTFPYIKKILNDSRLTPYSYYNNVRADKYIASAFRMYYRMGMSKVKLMDVDFLLRVLGAVKSFSENEIEMVKQQIRNQIRERLQVKATELSQFTESQQRQIQRKAAEMQQTIQGGVERGLMFPQQFKVGQNPANFELPPGGPNSSQDLVNPQGL